MSRSRGLGASTGVVAALLLTVLVGATAIPAGTERHAGTIAFLRSGLFVIRADGSGLRRLTPPGTSVFPTYEWSPDGKLIAYADWQRGSLWLVRPDGTGRRLLVPASRLSTVDLSWSPDGKEIAIVSGGPNRDPRRTGKLALYIVSIGGGKPVLVAPPRRGLGFYIAWSPRGEDIAYGGGGVLGVISRNGGRPRLLLTDGVGEPEWSPDGTKLAAPTVIHLGHLRTLRYNRITVVNADGSGRHVVTDHAYTEYPFAWSPDSRQIVYGRQDDHGINVISVDGRADHRVTRDSPPQTGWPALAWSPDGRSIVYTTDRTGNGDLYVIDVDGHNRIQLTSSPDRDTDPSWAPR